MAAVDLEPAERIRANQREEVLIVHASQPSLFYDKRKKNIQYTGIQVCWNTGHETALGLL